MIDIYFCIFSIRVMGQPKIQTKSILYFFILTPLTIYFESNLNKYSFLSVLYFSQSREIFIFRLPFCRENSAKINRSIISRIFCSHKELIISFHLSLNFQVAAFNFHEWNEWDIKIFKTVNFLNHWNSSDITFWQRLTMSKYEKEKISEK